LVGVADAAEAKKPISKKALRERVSDRIQYQWNKKMSTPDRDVWDVYYMGDNGPFMAAQAWRPDEKALDAPFIQEIEDEKQEERDREVALEGGFL